ncbi:MAG TPA: DMT family transporter [Tepidisphaeraceae bacterium]|jgi:transporter family-2 protein
MLILALVVLAGMGQPVQVAANSELRQAVKSPILSALISFAVGAIVLLALMFCGVLGGRGKPSGIAAAPWWGWIGGFFGAFSVVIAIVALPRSNVATVIAFTILGQLLASIAVDHFGWLRVPQVPINGSRVMGAILLTAGAFFIHRK